LAIDKKVIFEFCGRMPMESVCFSHCVSRFVHDCGYFLIHTFFFPDTASVHAHPLNVAANPDVFAACGRGNF